MNPSTLRLIVIIFQCIALLVLFTGLFFVTFQKPSNVQKDLIFISVFLSLTIVAYIIELQGVNKDASFIGLCLGFIGKTFTNMSLLWLLVDYSKVKVKKILVIAYVSFYSILMVLLMTTKAHGLFYKDFSFDLNKYGSPLLATRGVLFYIYLVASFLSFIIYAFIIIKEMKETKIKKANGINSYLLLSMLMPMIGFILYLFNLTLGIDGTLIGNEIGILFLIIMFLKNDLFNIISFGKDKALDDSKNVIIIVDFKNRISYFNKTAPLLISGLKENINYNDEQGIIEKLNEYKENEPVYINERIYLFKRNTYSNGKIDLGISYIFTDVTSDYNYQKRLENEVLEKTSQIKSIQKNILISFAELIEARDGYTGKHVHNVAKATNLIANELKKNKLYSSYLSNSYIDNLTELAVLHDVGKIKISDTILKKHGSLVGDELIEMQKHAKLGSDIIKQAFKDVEENEIINMASCIAMYHHEWFDGNGYPNKIKGNDIPLSARIVAVADVYDALRSKRPYKESFDINTSINIIKSESGTHFDPVIVEAFLNVVDDIENKK